MKLIEDGHPGLLEVMDASHCIGAGLLLKTGKWIAVYSKESLATRVSLLNGWLQLAVTNELCVCLAELGLCSRCLLVLHLSCSEMIRSALAV